MFKSYVLLVVICFFNACLSFPADAETRYLLKEPAAATHLDRGYGYALIDLAIEGTSPSLEIEPLAVHGKTYWTSEDAPVIKHKGKTIELGEHKNGFYLVALPAGLYQVIQVNAPYFDLPYKLPTEDRREWRFSVEANKLNYIGKLMIDKNRSTQYIDINLVNRIATDKAAIESQFSALMQSLPLTLAVGVRDDFLEDYQIESKVDPQIKTTDAAIANKEQ